MATVELARKTRETMQSLVWKRTVLLRRIELLTCWLGVLTKEFLDFSASRGNNLRSIGLGKRPVLLVATHH